MKRSRINFNNNVLVPEGHRREIHIVYDYPLDTEPFVAAILEMDDSLSPVDVKDLLNNYLRLPMYDIVDAVEKTCRHYGLDSEKCLRAVGLTSSVAKYHAYRVNQGWGCRFCGLVFRTKSEAIVHLGGMHHIEDTLVAPDRLVFATATEILPSGIRPFEDETHYLLAVSDILGVPLYVDDDDEELMDEWEEMEMRHIRSLKGATPSHIFVLRARHLLSLEAGISFNIDKLVRDYELEILDTVILLKLIRSSISSGIIMREPFFIGPSRRRRVREARTTRGIAGLTPAQLVEYCRESGRLLRTGLVEIEGDSIKLSDKRVKEILLSGKEFRDDDWEGIILQDPEITLDDVVLSDSTRRKLELAINSWKNRRAYMGDKKMEKYGNAMGILLSGPPGTGKTYTAYGIAGTLGLKVMEANISEIFNSYVGETEKNIRQMFRIAEENDALLLIDEADAMVSRRGSITRAADRLFNAEINVFLQELERFSGIVVLTTNLHENLDRALMRRVAVKIIYRPPSEKEREALWRKLLPEDVSIDDSVSISDLARKYKFTGAQIRNVIRNAIMAAEARGARRHGRVVLTGEDIATGIEMEEEEERNGDMYIQ